MKEGMKIDIYTDRRAEVINAKLRKRRPDIEKQEYKKTGIEEEIWEAELVHEMVLITRYDSDQMFTIDWFLTEQELG